MNRDRRKSVGVVFFDVAKYLLTTTAVGSFIVKNVNLIASATAVIASFTLIVIAYYITPKDKE